MAMYAGTAGSFPTFGRRDSDFSPSREKDTDDGTPIDLKDLLEAIRSKTVEIVELVVDPPLLVKEAELESSLDNVMELEETGMRVSLVSLSAGMLGAEEEGTEAQMQSQFEILAEEIKEAVGDEKMVDAALAVTRGIQVSNKVEQTSEDRVNKRAFNEEVKNLIGRDDGSYERFLGVIDGVNSMANSLNPTQRAHYRQGIIQMIQEQFSEAEMSKLMRRGVALHVIGERITFTYDSNGQVVPNLEDADFIVDYRDGEFRLVQSPIRVPADAKVDEALVFEDSLGRTLPGAQKGTRENKGGNKGGNLKFNTAFATAAVVVALLVAGYNLSKSSPSSIKVLKPQSTPGLGTAMPGGNNKPAESPTPTPSKVPTKSSSATPSEVPATPTKTQEEKANEYPNAEAEKKAGYTLYASESTPWVFKMDKDGNPVDGYNRQTGQKIPVGPIPGAHKGSRGKDWTPFGVQVYRTVDGRIIEFAFGGLVAVPKNPADKVADYYFPVFDDAEDLFIFLRDVEGVQWTEQQINGFINDQTANIKEVYGFVISPGFDHTLTGDFTFADKKTKFNLYAIRFGEMRVFVYMDRNKVSHFVILRNGTLPNGMTLQQFLNALE